jgi:hypothetical protein
MAFFAAGSMLGWSGVLGSTRRILEVVNQFT